MKWMAIGLGILLVAGMLHWRQRARWEHRVDPDA